MTAGPDAAVPSRLFALVDCSAFYVSCERVFDPRLEGVPVAVLSNNDGCVIARSQEVKDMGVRMGEPFFKCRGLLAERGARVYSSNYTLYGDMSRRVMETLYSVAPDVLQYSIDEAFLVLPTGGRTGPEVREWAERLATEVRRRVLRWTGIPVRVSVAETKTLAKAASEYARARLAQGGEPVVCFWGHREREAWLASMPVEDVWGVGRKWGQRLRDLGGGTAAGFAGLSDHLIRRHLNVVGLRTAYELRGVSCVPLDEAPVSRQTMIRSRSFGEPVAEHADVERAVATHAARAGERLRREGLVAGRIGAFVTTKGYGAGPHRSGWVERDLAVATSRTPDLIRAALLCLRQALTAAPGPTYRYRKAGVVLSEMRTEGAEQTALFHERDREGDPVWTAAQARLMEAIDRANGRFGKQSVSFGSMGPPSALKAVRAGTGAPVWESRRERMTPRYTTRWSELPVVHVE